MNHRARLQLTLLAICIGLGAPTRAADVADPGEADWPLVRITDKIQVLVGPFELPDEHNHGFRNTAVIVSTSAGLVVFDPGGSAWAGEMLVHRLQRLSADPVVAVFNSHAHGDHWLGNEGVRRHYPDVAIYAHPTMKAKAQGPDGRMWLRTIERLTEGSAGGRKLTPPNRTVADGEVITVGDTRFRILHTGAAHTDNDILIEVIRDEAGGGEACRAVQRLGRIRDPGRGPRQPCLSRGRDGGVLMGTGGGRPFRWDLPGLNQHESRPFAQSGNDDPHGLGHRQPANAPADCRRTPRVLKSGAPLTKHTPRGEIMENWLLNLTFSLALGSSAALAGQATHEAALPGTPQIRAAIQHVLYSNREFAANHDADYFKPFMEGQTPTATVVSCADSRVHMHAVDEHPDNEVFVIRNIGNQISTSAGSVEYGILHLHTPLLLIIGHSACGAVKAALGDYSGEPEGIKRELDSIHIDKDSAWMQGVIANVNNQVAEALKEFGDQVEGGHLAVMGAVYDFRDDLKHGPGVLSVINLNGETDPAKIKESPLLAGMEGVSVGTQAP